MVILKEKNVIVLESKKLKNGLKVKKGDSFRVFAESDQEIILHNQKCSFSVSLDEFNKSFSLNN